MPWLRDYCVFEGRRIPVRYVDIFTSERKGLSLVTFKSGRNPHDAGTYAFWTMIGPRTEEGHHLLSMRCRSWKSPVDRMKKGRVDLPPYQDMLDNVIALIPAPAKLIDEWLWLHPLDIPAGDDWVKDELTEDAA